MVFASDSLCQVRFDCASPAIQENSKQCVLSQPVGPPHPPQPCPQPSVSQVGRQAVRDPAVLPWDLQGHRKGSTGALDKSPGAALDKIPGAALDKIPGAALDKSPGAALASHSI
jgi:hypothetical protein